MERDQRPYLPLPRDFDVTVQSSRGHWAGKTSDLTPLGAKVTLVGNSVRLPLMAVVQLRIALPDGTPPLSLPARVLDTDSDGVSLSFFNLRDEAQRLKDLLDSHRPQGSQVVLDQSRSEGSPNSEPHVATQSSILPEFVEETRPAAAAATPNEARNGEREAAEELEPEPAEERAVRPSDVRAEEARLQELLVQAGLSGLCLPANGLLSPQWRKFLEQLGPKASSNPTGSRSSRPARAEGADVVKGRGDSSRTSRRK